MIKNIIETFNLSKIYKLKSQNREIIALNNINLSVKEGEIFGLLGPNGSGKTTLIKLLTLIEYPSNGYAIIDGYNILKEPKIIKNKISLMLGNKMLYLRVTGYSNLKFFCKLYKVRNYKEKINQLSKEFGLKRWLNEYVSKYSSGMKTKLALCKNLLLERKILFLDEPTLGLDLKNISFIIEKLKNLEISIFLASHNIKFIQKVCDRVAFINKGNITKIGTISEIGKVINDFYFKKGFSKS